MESVDVASTDSAPFRDRREGGSALAARLGWYAGRDDVTVLGLARGGVPVAAEVAGRLCAPLDVLVVRKLGLPWAPEVAFGAIGPDGVLIRSEDQPDGVTPGDLDDVLAAERTELDRQDTLYRADHPALDLHDRITVIVDDGLATGSTARAAIAVARQRNAVRVVLGVPVGHPTSLDALSHVADEVVCPLVPRDFSAVGQFYQDFRQVPDAEVRGLLG
ncbi:MAG: phosphoribosyltransferase family protein [Actinocatenispora sp.]